MQSQHIIVGISGASGAIYGRRIVETLAASDVQTHLVITKSGQLTLAQETDESTSRLRDLADHYYPIGDIGAAIASGSFPVCGMVVAPCSMKTLAEIALGTTTNLLTRAADVCLKERRRLVLMVRETPLHSGHIRHMQTLSDMGAIIAPPVPAFYNRPQTLDDIVNHSAGRVLDLFGIDTALAKQWQGLHKPYG